MLDASVLDGLEGLAAAVARDGAALWRSTLPAALARGQGGLVLRRTTLAVEMGVEASGSGDVLALRLHGGPAAAGGGSAQLRAALAAAPPDELASGKGGPWQAVAPAWCALPGAGWRRFLPQGFVLGVPMLVRLPAGGVFGAILPYGNEAQPSATDRLGQAGDRTWTNVAACVSRDGQPPALRQPGQAWDATLLRDMAAALCGPDAGQGGTPMPLPDAGPMHDLAQGAGEAWTRLRRGLTAAALPPGAAGMGAVAYAVESLAIEVALAGPHAVALSAARSSAGQAEARVAAPAGLALGAEELGRLHAALFAAAAEGGRGPALRRASCRAGVWTSGHGAAFPTCLLRLDEAGQDMFVQASVEAKAGRAALQAWRVLDAGQPGGSLAPDAPFAAVVMRAAGQHAAWWAAAAGVQ